MLKTKNFMEKYPNLLFSTVSIALIIAIFVCVLCDYVLNNSLTWSLYPTASCIFVWLVSLPLIRLRKRGVIISMCIFSLLVIPFLYCIELACPVKDWMLPLGVPVSVASLAYIWIAGILLFKSKLRKWYTASIIVFLTVPLDYFINSRVNAFLHSPMAFMDIINTMSLICASLVLFFIGLATKKKDQNI